jgi:DNA-binding response OmpR family regulator
MGAHSPAGGEQALAVLKQTGGCGGGKDKGGTFFDLVVTDFYLKGAMNAANLLHAIRVQMRYSQQEMPVLVITAGDAEKNQIEAFRAGANDFVNKPFVNEILITRVRSLLSVAAQAVASAGGLYIASSQNAKGAAQLDAPLLNTVAGIPCVISFRNACGTCLPALRYPSSSACR